jgi:hypothetical protein
VKRWGASPQREFIMAEISLFFLLDLKKGEKLIERKKGAKVRGGIMAHLRSLIRKLSEISMKILKISSD